MSFPFHKPARWVLLVVLTFPIAGCARGVEEDRTIEFAPQGQSVSFQHGQDGLYVYDAELGRIEKIYQPTEDVLATSTPLWSSDGNRLAFCTAKADESDPALDSETVTFAQGMSWDANPNGRRFPKIPAIYQCWICERGQDRKMAKPQMIFQSRVTHVGLIAANLAMRWHPNGERLVFLDRSQETRHVVKEWDLEDGNALPAASFEAEYLLFDWNPTGTRMTCVVQDAKSPANNGIWIKQPGEEQWWQVPHSEIEAQTEDSIPLNELRKLRLSWSRDGKRFAFSNVPSAQQKTKIQTVLYVGELEPKTVRVFYQTEGSIRDVHWSPDGESLGYVLDSQQLQELRASVLSKELSSILMLHKFSEPEPVPWSLNPVRTFAGWNTQGTQLAYTVPSPFGPKAQMGWAFLLPVRGGARDRVMIADAAKQSPQREVFSGMRTAFFNWSPEENQLSMWATFSPSHSLLPLGPPSSFGLQPGDPAALLDTQTGAVKWMPVNAREKVQIGHYYLIKKNYQTAKKWYDEATDDFANNKAKLKKTIAELGAEQFSLFQFHCMQQLEDATAAEDHLKVFFQETTPKEQTDAKVLSLARQLSIGQVFLSLNATPEGITYFEQQPEKYRKLIPASHVEHDLFAGKIARAQLLLNANRFDEFARLATTDILPALLKRKELDRCDGQTIQESVHKMPLATASGFCLLPLMAKEFVYSLSEETVQEVIPRWESLREQTQSQTAQLWMDRLLSLAYSRMGNNDLALSARIRFESNPQHAKFDLESLTGLRPEDDLKNPNIRQWMQVFQTLQSL